MIAPTECPDRGIVAQESEVRHRSETEIRGLGTGGEAPRDHRHAQPLVAAAIVIVAGTGTVIAVAVAGTTVAGTAETALARIWSRASASEKATCVGPTPESPSEAASLPASPQRPTTIGNAANRARSRRTW